jgi:hypothetical protein
MTDDPSVLRCQSCGGVFTVAPVTMEQVLKFVSVHLPMVLGEYDPFYFDFVVSSHDPGRMAGTRMHGWADRKTKRVVQWG